MAIKRWHWVVTAEMILAASVVGEAGAQQGVLKPQVFPPAPETVVVVPAQPASASAASPAPACATRSAPLHTLWHNWRERLERCLGSERPDLVPAGQSLYQSMSNQIDNGIAVRMILNDFDFEQGGAKLNYRGEDKLRHLGVLALKYPYPIIVERTVYNPELAKIRVAVTRLELARLCIPLPPNRIVDGADVMRGLYGIESRIMYLNLLEQTQARGLIVTEGGAGGGGQQGEVGSSGAGQGQAGTSR